MTPADGKYDDVCEAALRRTNAAGVILCVLEGNKGDGFSVAINLMKFVARRSLPSVLRELADKIEALENEQKAQSS